MTEQEFVMKKLARSLISIACLVAGSNSFAAADLPNDCAHAAQAMTGVSTFSVHASRQVIPGLNRYKLELVSTDDNLKVTCDIRRDRVVGVLIDERDQQSTAKQNVG